MAAVLMSCRHSGARPEGREPGIRETSVVPASGFRVPALTRRPGMTAKCLRISPVMPGHDVEAHCPCNVSC